MLFLFLDVMLFLIYIMFMLFLLGNNLILDVYVMIYCLYNVLSVLLSLNRVEMKLRLICFFLF